MIGFVRAFVDVVVVGLESRVFEQSSDTAVKEQGMCGSVRFCLSRFCVCVFVFLCACDRVCSFVCVFFVGFVWFGVFLCVSVGPARQKPSLNTKTSKRH